MEEVFGGGGVCARVRVCVYVCVCMGVCVGVCVLPVPAIAGSEWIWGQKQESDQDQWGSGPPASGVGTVCVPKIRCWRGPVLGGFFCTP